MLQEQIRRLKSRVRRVQNRLFGGRRLAEKSSPLMKVTQRHLFNYYQHEVAAGRTWNLGDTGFRNFSEYEEDGVLLYIFAAIGTTNRQFVDIGAGDCINSNCANLAINFGWHGLFIDGNPANIKRGKAYYKRHPDAWAFQPKFLCDFVHRENINQLLESQGFRGGIDLVSIDLDGNDYWIWDALSVVQPRVVVIETHVEFGMHSIVVPYDKDYFFPGKHPDYHGASAAAMAKLARSKGYRLVGSSAYGFNTIYVRDGIGEAVLPEVTVESVLAHPRNAERFKRFEAIKDWEYIRV